MFGNQHNMEVNLLCHADIVVLWYFWVLFVVLFVGLNTSNTVNAVAIVVGGTNAMPYPSLFCVRLLVVLLTIQVHAVPAQMWHDIKLEFPVYVHCVLSFCAFICLFIGICCICFDVKTF